MKKAITLTPKERYLAALQVIDSKPRQVAISLNTYGFESFEEKLTNAISFVDNTLKIYNEKYNK